MAKAREERDNESALNKGDRDVVGADDADDGGAPATTAAIVIESGTQIDGTDEASATAEMHKKLRNEVGDMYSVWDEADARFV